MIRFTLFIGVDKCKGRADCNHEFSVLDARCGQPEMRSK